MSAKPLRTMPKRASAERCLRPLGATIIMVTPARKTANRSGEGRIVAYRLRKDNPEVTVITGFYLSPGIADRPTAKLSHRHYRKPRRRYPPRRCLRRQRQS